jgi:hypothetical protein
MHAILEYFMVAANVLVYDCCLPSRSRLGAGYNDRQCYPLANRRTRPVFHTADLMAGVIIWYR